MGAVGCLKCGNPRGENGDALIVEVKAQYKRDDWSLKAETPTRQHCIYAGIEFWTCLSQNLVIEPDSSWLPDGDRPTEDLDGTLVCPVDPRA